MRFRRRLREAVATSSEPQLLRGQDDWEAGDQPEPWDDIRDHDPDGDADYNAWLKERSFSRAQRDKAERSGAAMRGGKYPIHDEEDLQNAWRLRNNGSASLDSVVAHICKRAQALGLAMPGDTRESQPFHSVVREATVGRRGGGYECVLIREGCGNESDRNWYSAEALHDAVNRGLFNCKCFADHPTRDEERNRPERSVRGVIGSFTESRFVPGNPAEVRAVFRPVEGAGFEWVRSLIESAIGSPDLVGLSIDGHGACDGVREVNGRQYSVVREISHLGSVDLVTAAGAGGRFVRKLSESVAEIRRVTTDTPIPMSAAQLQTHVRESVSELLDGLEREDADAVRLSTLRLSRAAHASLIGSQDTDRLQEADRQLVEDARLLEVADATLAEERRLRLAAEARADAGDRFRTAQRLLREVRGIPPKTLEAWAEELVSADDEDSARAVLARRKVEHDDMLAEIRESLDLDRVEGAGPRQPATPSNGYSSADGALMRLMGINPEDLEI